MVVVSVDKSTESQGTVGIYLSRHESRYCWKSRKYRK